MIENIKIGEIVRVDTKTGFYQIVAERNAEQVYVRKLFDNKLNFKLGKAELYHKSWLFAVSDKYNVQIEALLAEHTDIKKAIEV